MPVSTSTFAAKLIRWYRLNKRELPWRQTSDPYKIWLSEIILQQTRVDQGLPYYNKFIETFENVDELAQASEDEVLRLWQGLGYYSRARNLHACAKCVSEMNQGKFPDRYQDLLKLPGIGPYTAAAIASISFGEAVPVVDGNVFRVLSRIFGIDTNIADPKSRKSFVEKSAELMDGSRPEEFNQAVMEFGALHCTPKNPKCSECVFQETCYAWLNGLQHKLPVNEKKKRIKKRQFHYIILKHKNSLFMRKREGGDVWQGLYDFFLIERDAPLSPEEVLADLIEQGLKDIILSDISEPLKHVLTHQVIYARFFTIEVNDYTFAESFADNNQLKLFSTEAIEKLPKPRLIDRFLTEEKFYLT